jgi:hypothetical protein
MYSRTERAPAASSQTPSKRQLGSEFTGSLRWPGALLAIIASSQMATAADVPNWSSQMTSASAADGWTEYAQVLELYPTISDTYFVRLDVTSNAGSCTDQAWFYYDGTGPGANRVFAALLSAQATGALVRVHVTGTCYPQYGYSEISSVTVKS